MTPQPRHFRIFSLTGDVAEERLLGVQAGGSENALVGVGRAGSRCHLWAGVLVAIRTGASARAG